MKFISSKFIANWTKPLAGYWPHSTERERARREVMAKGVDVIKFAPAIAYYPTPENVKQAIIDCMNANLPQLSNEPRDKFKEAIIDKVKLQQKIEVEPSQILITAAATQANFIVPMAVLNPGDEVLHQSPGYTHNYKSVIAAGGVSVPVPSDEHKNHAVFREDWERRITPKTKIISIVNPVNCTARVNTEKELKILCDLALEYDLLVHSDDVYEYQTYHGTKYKCIASMPEMEDRTVLTFNFSKCHGMNKWRLGYIVTPKELVPAMSTSMTMCSGGVVSHAVMEAGAVALKNAEYIEYIRKDMERMRDLVVKRISEIPGIHYYSEIEGGGATFPNVSEAFPHDPKNPDKACIAIMREAGCAVDPGRSRAMGPEGEGHIRLSFGTEPYERLEIGLDRIDELFRKRIKK